MFVVVPATTWAIVDDRGIEGVDRAGDHQLEREHDLRGDGDRIDAVCGVGA